MYKMRSEKPEQDMTSYISDFRQRVWQTFNRSIITDPEDGKSIVRPFTASHGVNVFRALNYLLIDTPVTKKPSYINISSLYDYPDTFQEKSLFSKDGLCAYKFEPGDVVVSCNTCQYDDSCVLCLKCYMATNHIGHEVYFKVTSGYTGNCDCGDSDSWKRTMSCHMHKNTRHDLKYSVKKHLESVFPEIVEHLRVLIEECIEYIIQVTSRLHTVLNFEDNRCTAESIKSYSDDGILQDNGLVYDNMHTTTVNCDDRGYRPDWVKGGEPYYNPSEFYILLKSKSMRILTKVVELLKHFFSESKNFNIYFDIYQDFLENVREDSGEYIYIPPMTLNKTMSVEIERYCYQQRRFSENFIAIENAATLRKLSCAYYTSIWLLNLSNNVNLSNNNETHPREDPIRYIIDELISDIMLKQSYTQPSCINNKIFLDTFSEYEIASSNGNKSITHFNESIDYAWMKDMAVKKTLYQHGICTSSASNKPGAVSNLEMFSFLTMTTKNFFKSCFFEFQSRLIIYCRERKRPEVFKVYVSRLLLYLYWNFRYEKGTSSVVTMLFSQLLSTEYMYMNKYGGFPTLATLLATLENTLFSPDTRFFSLNYFTYMNCFENLYNGNTLFDFYISYHGKTLVNSNVNDAELITQFCLFVLSTPEGRKVHLFDYANINFEWLAKLCLCFQESELIDRNTGYNNEIRKRWSNTWRAYINIYTLISVLSDFYDCLRNPKLLHCASEDTYFDTEYDYNMQYCDMYIISLTIVRNLKKCLDKLIECTTESGSAILEFPFAEFDQSYVQSFPGIRLHHIMSREPFKPQNSQENLSDTSYIASHLGSSNGTRKYIPLHWLFASTAASVCHNVTEWAKYGIYLNAHHLIDCSTLSNTSKNSIWRTLFARGLDDDNPGAIDERIMLVMDNPLELLVLMAQLRAGICERNREDLASRLFSVEEHESLVNEYNIFILQIASVILPKRTFLIWLLNKFKVSAFTKIGSPNFDNNNYFTKCLSNRVCIHMHSELCVLLLIILNNRSIINYQTRREFKKKALIKLISRKPSGWKYHQIDFANNNSNLKACPPAYSIRRKSERTIDDTDGTLMNILSGICDVRSDKTGKTMPIFTLKKEFYNEINIWDIFFDQSSRQVVELEIIRNKFEKLGISHRILGSYVVINQNIWTHGWVKSLLNRKKLYEDMCNELMREENAASVDIQRAYLHKWLKSAFKESTTFVIPELINPETDLGSLGSFLDSDVFIIMVTLPLLGLLFDLPEYSQVADGMDIEHTKFKGIMSGLCQNVIQLIASAFICRTLLLTPNEHRNSSKSNDTLEPDILYKSATNGLINNTSTCTILHNKQFYCEHQNFSLINIIKNIVYQSMNKNINNLTADDYQLRSLIEVIYLCCDLYEPDTNLCHIRSCIHSIFNKIDNDDSLDVHDGDERRSSTLSINAVADRKPAEIQARKMKIISEFADASRLFSLKYNMNEVSPARKEVKMSFTDEVHSLSDDFNDSLSDDSNDSLLPHINASPNLSNKNDSVSELDKMLPDLSFTLKQRRYDDMQCVVCHMLYSADEESTTTGGIMCHLYHSKIEKAVRLTSKTVKDILSDSVLSEEDSNTCNNMNKTASNNSDNDDYFRAAYYSKENGQVSDDTLLRVENSDVAFRHIRPCIKSCGHFIHHKCLPNHVRNYMMQDNDVIYDNTSTIGAVTAMDARIALDTETALNVGTASGTETTNHKWFRCPLCSKISNVVIPLIWKKSTEIIFTRDKSEQASRISHFNQLGWWYNSLEPYSWNIANIKSPWQAVSCEEGGNAMEEHHSCSSYRPEEVMSSSEQKRKSNFMSCPTCKLLYRTATIDSDIWWNVRHRDPMKTASYQWENFHRKPPKELMRGLHKMRIDYVNLYPAIPRFMNKEQLSVAIPILSIMRKIMERVTNNIYHECYNRNPSLIGLTDSPTSTLSLWELSMSNSFILDIYRNNYQILVNTIGDMEIRHRFEKKTIISRPSDGVKLYVYPIFERLSDREMLHLRLLSECMKLGIASYAHFLSSKFELPQRSSSNLDTLKSVGQHVKPVIVEKVKERLLCRIFYGFATDDERECLEDTPEKHLFNKVYLEKEEKCTIGIPILYRNTWSLCTDVILFIFNESGMHTIKDLYSWVNIFYTLDVIKSILSILNFLGRSVACIIKVSGIENYTFISDKLNVTIAELCKRTTYRKLTCKQNDDVRSFLLNVATVIANGYYKSVILRLIGIDYSFVVGLCEKISCQLLRRLVLLLQVKFGIIPSEDFLKPTKDSEFEVLRKYFMLPSVEEILCYKNTTDKIPIGIMINGWLTHYYQCNTYNGKICNKQINNLDCINTEFTSINSYSFLLSYLDKSTNENIKRLIEKHIEHVTYPNAFLNYVLRSIDKGTRFGLGSPNYDFDQIYIDGNVLEIFLCDPREPQLVRLPHKIENFFGLYSKVMCSCCKKVTSNFCICLICGEIIHSNSSDTYYCVDLDNIHHNYTGMIMIANHLRTHVIRCTQDVGIFLSSDLMSIVYYYDMNIRIKYPCYSESLGEYYIKSHNHPLSTLNKNLYDIVKRDWLKNEIQDIVDSNLGFQ